MVSGSKWNMDQSLAVDQELVPRLEPPMLAPTHTRLWTHLTLIQHGDEYIGKCLDSLAYFGRANRERLLG